MRALGLVACLFCALSAGCAKEKDSDPSGTSPPVSPGNEGFEKWTARELFDAHKIGKDVNGKRVEVTGWVRASESDRAQLPKIVFEGDDSIGHFEVFFYGKVTEEIKRGDTATVRGTVSAKSGTLTVKEAKLIEVKPGKAREKKP
ncbi:MAG: hypothetical protein L0241_25130 [Planctomycetia bacterium]|nr:hypothetical protein [Planctomycetia bacterium]